MRLTRYPENPEAVAPAVAAALIAQINELDVPELPLVPPMAEIQNILRQQYETTEGTDGMKVTIAELKAIRDEHRQHLRLSGYAPPKVQARLQLSIQAMDALIREREADDSAA